MLHRLLLFLLLLTVIAILLAIVSDGLRIVHTQYRSGDYITIYQYNLWIATIRIPPSHQLHQYRVRYYRVAKVG